MAWLSILLKNLMRVVQNADIPKYQARQHAACCHDSCRERSWAWLQVPRNGQTVKNIRACSCCDIDWEDEEASFTQQSWLCIWTVLTSTVARVEHSLCGKPLREHHNGSRWPGGNHRLCGSPGLLIYFYVQSDLGRKKVLCSGNICRCICKGLHGLPERRRNSGVIKESRYAKSSRLLAIGQEQLEYAEIWRLDILVSICCIFRFRQKGRK